MKVDIFKKVATLVPNSAIRNQALLQKLRLDLPKLSGRQEERITEERQGLNKKQEEEVKLSRRHYKCHICNMYYPSIGQHITRKHITMDDVQKCTLRKKMIECRTLNGPPRTTKKPTTELLTANLNSTLTNICNSLPNEVSVAITEFATQMSFLVRQREVNYIQTLGLIERILLYCVKYGTTNDRSESKFDWSICMSEGIKDLLMDDNINKLSQRIRLFCHYEEKGLNMYHQNAQLLSGGKRSPRQRVYPFKREWYQILNNVG